MYEDPPHAVLVSEPPMEAIAAFATLRLTVHATMPRQKTTHPPRKASMAPTQIKRVPSGRFERCMNGASAVYGMTSVGIPAPAMVGIPDRWYMEVEEVEEVASLVVCEELSVVDAEDDVDDAVVEAVVSVMVESSGRSVRV